jgi:hypothetical protein
MQLTAWPPTRGVQMLMMLLPLAFLLRTETLGWLARWVLLCYAGAVVATWFMPPVSFCSLFVYTNSGWDSCSFEETRASLTLLFHFSFSVVVACSIVPVRKCCSPPQIPSCF